jgi:hypothetical protein
MQSPKSKRASAPAETPAQDNNPQVNKGGTHPECHAGGSPPTPRVPPGLQHHGGRHQGNESNLVQNPEVHSEAPHQGGGPGYAKGKGDGERKGGSVHQT